MKLASPHSSHGWMIVHKPIGMNSTDVVRLVKRKFKPFKVGHAGTLDRLAYGVLPIAIGDATKVIPYMVEKEKVYEFWVVFGEARSTDDPEGEVIATSSIRPSEEQIIAALHDFKGMIMQRPPLYSAIKVSGKRASDRARAGEPPLLKERPVEIKSFELLSYEGERAQFRIRCSKGTYVRSLARDLSEKLGTKGYAEKIYRVSVGTFSDSDSISTEVLAKLDKIALLEKYIYAVDMVLDDIPAIRIAGVEKRKLCQGQAILHDSFPIRGNAVGEGAVVLCLDEDDQAVALAVMTMGLIQPKRIFQTERI
ncbi:MAG: tRNA pseudouridine(55) synthase TruB [Candidatus Nucleicultricaceae bacterium]